MSSRISSLNNDLESKELEINRFKKKHQDAENQNSTLNATVEKLKYNA